MAGRGVAVLLLALMAGGCTQTTLQPASDAAMKPRDKQLLANAPYAKASVPEHFQRHIVRYHRRELPGTIVVDTDARYLYYVLAEGRAVRYGVTVGEDALTFSGIAKVGRKEEWPSWVPTKDILQRIEGLPKFVEGGPKNPLGARGLYLFDGSKDTLFRIHGTNQPELIGEAISSGCIRMTNEDVIELYDKVKIGTPVVVLGPKNGDSPTNPRVAMTSMRD